jgi:glycosyltransferase involved in cell wall biosynthesis
LVWYTHADSFVGIGDPSFGPAVVDLDNLEQNVLRPRFLSLPVSSTGGDGALRLLRLQVIDFLKRTLNWRDRVLWSRLQQRIARLATSTLVCSEDDQKRLQPLQVAVVPNSYADPGPLSEDIIAAPILVMVGLFTYEPNLDGARWFAYEVFPTLRQLVPGVIVRLVGRNDQRLLTTISIPGIEIVGEVDEIGQELRHARGTIVPLLSGSGTRIKVLEALAYGLPVVTTKVGCEGLGIVSDVHALVRDDPVEFATACAQMLTDDEVLQRLRLNGRRLFLDHYEAGSVATRIKQLAMDVVISNSIQPGEEHDRDQ